MVPIAKAVLASFDKAPKDMCDTKIGDSNTIGFLAFFPMTVLKLTFSFSKSGILFNCPPSIKISSQLTIGNLVPIADIILFPSIAIV